MKVSERQKLTLISLFFVRCRILVILTFVLATLASSATASPPGIVHSPLLLYLEEETRVMAASLPNSSSITEADVEFFSHVYVMPCLLFIGLINQCLNVWTLSTLPSVGFLYLKASAIADILSIFALIPFCLRHGGLSDEHNYYIMFYHAHLELPVINSLITASAHCLVAMTIDRWLSINYPIVFHNSPGSKTRIRNVIFLIYFCAFLIFSISGLQKKLEIDPHSEYLNETVRYVMVRNQEITQKLYFRVYLVIREVF